MGNISLSVEEITDMKRALIIAMQQLDSTGNKPDNLLSDRLEQMKDKLERLINQA